MIRKKWIVSAEIKIEASVWCYAESLEEATEQLKDMNRSGNIVSYNSIVMRSIDVKNRPRPWNCHVCGVDEGDMHRPNCLRRISEEDWNEVFQCPETKSPETYATNPVEDGWGPEIRSPETGKPTRLWPWRFCRSCYVQWELAKSAEPCPDCGHWGLPMPTRSDSVPMVAYSWYKRPLPRG